MRAVWIACVLATACGTAPQPAASTTAQATPALAPAPVVVAPPPVPPEPDPKPELPAPTMRGEVVLVALGDFPLAQLDAVEAHLRTNAAVDVRRPEPIALPREAWTSKRKRYRADRLLDFLMTQIPDAPATTRILGLTQVDISTTKPPHDDWGIFGLGQMPGQSAVVSTFRLKKKARDVAQIEHRLKNTALHEVGHTFGLDHCTEALCPMQDAQGSIANTDAANDAFGPLCTAALNDRFPIALR